MVNGVKKLIGLNNVVIFFRKFCLVIWKFFLGGFVLNVNMFFFGSYVIFSVFIVGRGFLLMFILDVLFLIGIFFRIWGELDNYLWVCIFVLFYSLFNCLYNLIFWVLFNIEFILLFIYVDFDIVFVVKGRLFLCFLVCVWEMNWVWKGDEFILNIIWLNLYFFGFFCWFKDFYKNCWYDWFLGVILIFKYILVML